MHSRMYKMKLTAVYVCTLHSIVDIFDLLAGNQKTEYTRERGLNSLWWRPEVFLILFLDFKETVQYKNYRY